MVHTNTYDYELPLSASQYGQIQMDTGVITAEPHSLKDLAQFSLLRPFLSLGEIVAIMDHLIMLEGIWLSGAPLHQTLFTHAYMFDPSLAPPPLRAFCVSILQIIALSKDIVFNSQISSVCSCLFL